MSTIAPTVVRRPRRSPSSSSGSAIGRATERAADDLRENRPVKVRGLSHANLVRLNAHRRMNHIPAPDMMDEVSDLIDAHVHPQLIAAGLKVLV